MKKTNIIISILLLLLALPALSHVAQSPATSQAIRNVTVGPDTVQLIGEVDTSLLPNSVGAAANTDPILSLVPTITVNPSSSAPATPAFTTIDVPTGSSYISVANSVEGTPGYNPNPCLCAPSDMGLAASSQYVVQMVNLAGTIYTTSGTIAKSTFSLSDFWFAPVRSMSDPQVLFDARSGHWFASILVIVNHIRFAVSATSDPLGIWYIYQVRAPASSTVYPASNILPDQPWIGYSDDKFLISANDFLFDANSGAGAFQGAQYWIINKAQMIAGAFAPDTSTITPDPSHISIRPVPTLSPTSDAYMVENCVTVSPGVLTSICPATSTGTAGGITVYTVTGAAAAPLVSSTTVPIRQTGFPGKADQPGNPASLNTNDNRITSAVWNQGKLWTALNDHRCSTASCVRLDEISTPVTPLSLIQDFAFTSNGASTFYGAVSLDDSNNLVVMFETSSLSVNPSLLVTGQKATALVNTLAPSTIVQSGSAPDLSTRWGDYFYAATQPGAPSTFWVSGDYRTITLFQGWQTRIGKIIFS
jgi:hypothetical protein